MRQVKLADGTEMPALGQGTWRLGERPAAAREETAALLEGIARGLTLIDTAEMYGEGATERFLGEALRGRRDSVYLVSKVYPHNAGQGAILRACEGSLRRLGTDRLDLYLLHWRGGVPLAETVAGMNSLRDAGKIGAWGVSNFAVRDMEELAAAGGTGCVTNQILYNVTRRGPEFDLLPALTRAGVATMAYSPVEQGRLPRGGALARIGRRHGVSPYQAALAWVLRQPGVIAIPKAASIDHVRENAAAAELALAPEDLAAIDAEFPPPDRRRPLEML